VDTVEKDLERQADVYNTQYHKKLRKAEDEYKQSLKETTDKFIKAQTDLYESQTICNNLTHKIEQLTAEIQSLTLINQGNYSDEINRRQGQVVDNPSAATYAQQELDSDDDIMAHVPYYEMDPQQEINKLHRGTKTRVIFSSQECIDIMANVDQATGINQFRCNVRSKKIELALRSLGLKRVPTPGDGNCLYYALKGIFNYKKSAIHLKNHVLDYMATQVDNWALGDDTESVEKLRQKNVYGNATVLAMAQRLFQRSIYVITWDVTNKKLVQISTMTDTNYPPIGFLFYVNAHYEQLISSEELYDLNALEIYKRWLEDRKKDEQASLMFI
ncbi:hypothetical protein, partial [Salmonella enterica]|uniref:hypothetical protein n=1 Tax=Salmonella enterica TaxID=28901 RepID=UPI00135EAC6D